MSEIEQATTRTGRMRALRAIGVTLLVALLFSFTVYLSSPGLRVWLGALFSHPAPYGTAGPVHLEHGAPWGTLTVDGRRVDEVGLETSFGELALAPGSHRLVYTAALFPTLDCVISAEAQSSDTCPLVRNFDSFETQVILRAEPGRIVNLGATFVRLPPPDQEALTAAVTAFLATLETTDTVAVGDRYRTSADTVATATAPLTARLLYQLNDDLQRTLPPGSDPSPCVTVCYGSGRITRGLDGAPVWVIGAHIVVNWAYSLGEEAPEIVAPAPRVVIPDEDIGLFVRWQVGHWQVIGQETLGRPPICSVALRQLQDAGAQFAPNLEAQVTVAKNPARGCLVSGLSPSPGADTMSFLYRFGVTLALDRATHDHLPSLLEATRAEQTIAAEIERDAH